MTIASSGAQLKLDFTGSEIVAKLFIGTTQQPAGQYGHSSTGATNGGQGVGAMDAYFSPATGTLTVSTSPPPLGYAGWAATHAATTGEDPNADEDHDGLANGIEYVLGGTGTGNDMAKLPTATAAAGNFVFTFIRDQTSIDGTTALTIELGTTLDNWPQSFPVPTTATTNNPGITVIKDSPTSGRDTIILMQPTTAGSKIFARLKAVP